MTDKINGNILNLEPSDYFTLTENFIGQYENKQPDWGPIGYVTYKRTYARPVGARNEEFWEGLKRVVEGIYTIQKWHCRRLGLPFNGVKAQASAQTMFKLIWEFKFCPSRGFWGMHLPLLNKVGAAPLYNCGTVSTKDIKTDFSNPFCWLMDFLMLGVGISSDTRGAERLRIVEPRVSSGLTFQVPDTREGWVELLGIILDAYAGKGAMPETIDYSLIRPVGTPLVTMGGIAPGPDPLKLLIKDMSAMLTSFIDYQLTSQGIVDLCNMIARCVVSGNIRRSAVLMLGEANDTEFMQLKDFKRFPEQNKAYRWASNNSVIHTEGMDYSWLAENADMTGELPGILFLQNAKKHGRMIDPETSDDTNIISTNPCFTGGNKLTIFENGGFIKKAFRNLDGRQVRVKTHTGEIVPGEVWMTGMREVVELTLYNYGKIKLTPDHILMGADGSQIPACDAKGKRLRIHIDPCTDHDKSWVQLGFIQGDGQTSRLRSEAHKGLEINIGKDDKDILKLFNLKDKNIRSYYVNGYNDILRDNGFSNKTLPTRELPQTIPINRVLSFLKGLFSANGCVVINHRIALKSTCKPMLLQVQNILQYHWIGIDSYITTNETKEVKFKNGTYTCKESYDLNIAKVKSVVAFYELIGFVHQYKTKALEELIATLSPKVTSVRPAGIKYVYDFSAPGVGWGIVNGVVVKNCGEIFLEDRELCNILETFPSRHVDYTEYEKTLKYAYLYTKTVTLIPTHDMRTNAVMMKNRRIGISQTGVVESFERHGHREHFGWCHTGYNYLRELDNKYSDWMAIPKSKKITTVKPSGTVSLLPGVTSGIHYPPAEYYYKLMRVGKLNPILKNLETAGYRIEDLKTDPSGATVVVYFPIKCNYYSKSDTEVSIWRQLENTAKMQYYWADNSVSVTIKYRPEEMTEIKNALELYESRLKSVSFMPVSDHAYEQPPWLPMTEAEYEVEISHLKTLRLKRGDHHDQDEKYCTSDTCII